MRPPPPRSATTIAPVHAWPVPLRLRCEHEPRFGLQSQLSQTSDEWSFTDDEFKTVAALKQAPPLLPDFHVFLPPFPLLSVASSYTPHGSFV